MKAFLCAVLFALCAPAWGAVYVWQTIDGLGFGPFTGQIEIDDAWGGGEYINAPICSHEQWAQVGGCTEPPYDTDLRAPDSPIIRLVFGPRLDLRFRTGEGFPYVAIGEFSLLLGAAMTGSLYVNNGETDLKMTTGGSDVWEIVDYASDAGSFCGYIDGGWNRCEGVTGRWVAQQVPAPGTLSLLAPLLYLTARTTRSARRARTASRA